MSTTYFYDRIREIAVRGRDLIGSIAYGDAGNSDINELCESLLSVRGEASGVAIADQILDIYKQLDNQDKQEFLLSLADQFDVNKELIVEKAQKFLETKDSASAIDLHNISEPRRLELLRRMNMAPGGTASLVDMRKDLISFLSKNPDLKHVDKDFQHLFASWFNRGFLVLRRIDWHTPAVVLEKIIQYEAVHAIDDWNDLRRRIEPPDRLCFAFFHPALLDEPLIFVEVALTKEIPRAISPILSKTREEVSREDATTAVFYSISNCQVGLRGISFGNFLIKQVVRKLLRELPKLTTFVTLSPVPGLVRWFDQLDRKLLSTSELNALDAIQDFDWVDSEQKEEILQTLQPLVAQYFVRSRDARGRIVDPVARFHLGNGARLERINANGDMSQKGLKQAAGFMVNYQYVMEDIEKNHELFSNRNEVVNASQVSKLLRSEHSGL